MKKILYLFLFVALSLSIFACAGDKPSQGDIDRTIKGLPLEGLTVYKTDEAGADKNGVYTMALWGLSKDRGEEMNIYAILQFEKKDGRWEGFLPVDGLIAEPVKEKGRDAFLAETSKDWTKLKGWIERSK